MRRAIETITLEAGALRAQAITLGAALHRLDVPDRDGARGNIVLGYRDLDAYRRHVLFFGAVIGRYANRIARGSFVLDGARYDLPINNAPNHLHGGPDGFHARDWEVAARDAASVTFALTSPAGDSGYPGQLDVTARYDLTEESLAVTLAAASDAPTVVAMTHHPYWNLAGEARGAAVTGHWLRVAAGRYTPVDADLIPTGELADVAGTPFDFRAAKPVGRDIGAADEQLARGSGFDHNLVVDGAGMRRVATLYDPASGRVLHVEADAPGLQFYSGNHLAGAPAGTGGRVYDAREGLCLEPQLFPDSPNQPVFPSARLEPGARYESRIVYRFGVAGSVEEAFG